VNTHNNSALGKQYGVMSAKPIEVKPCTHYRRKCNIVAPCCGGVFGCRLCHDEMTPTGHESLNRFAVKEVVCKECHTRQATSNSCIKCKVTFGEYHCNICNLWMQSEKEPFHCSECGICRVGGRDNFRHCDKCCMCLPIDSFNTHICKTDMYKNNCPVCQENMFISRKSALTLSCGHAIHANCFQNLSAYDYRCPICKKNAVSQDVMALAWSQRAETIKSHPMPQDLQRKVNIKCDDCEEKKFKL